MTHRTRGGLPFWTIRGDPTARAVDLRLARPAVEGRTAADGELSLRAALLALGIGLLWAALSRSRRRRPTDLW